MSDAQPLTIDATTVPYDVEGEGPVALVLIAEPGRERVLGVVSHYLVEEAGFHVITVAARSESESVQERVAATAAVLDHLGIEDAWIGGHGAGGTVARVFVEAHPDRSNGLLLLGVEDADIPLAPVIPVLIIQGAADKVTPPAHGDRLHATAAERVHLRTLDDADHLFPLTHPVQTAVIIEEHLDWD